MLFRSHQGGWRAPFWALGALAVLVWAALFALLPSVTRHLAPEGASARAAEPAGWRPELALGWVLTFGVVFSGFLLIPYLSPFMVGNLGLGLTDLSWVYLAGGLASLSSARGVGRLVDRLGPARVLGGLLAGTAVPFLVFTHLSSASLPGVMAVFVLFMGLTSSRVIPTVALVASRVPPALRGRYLAVNMAASDGASGLAAWASGLLIAEGPGGALVGLGLVGWLAVGVTAATTGVLWRFSQRAEVPRAAPA